MKPVERRRVLVIEDSPEDFGILERVLAEYGVNLPVVRVGDAQVAIEEIRGSDPSDLPCLIILDLNLPGMDGHEFLEALRGDETTRLIPVVVLTSSDNPDDVGRAYLRGANSYVRKPITYREYRASVGRLLDFWLHTAELPQRGFR